jgi:hypothetical protein
MNYFKKRHAIVVNRCCMCKKNGESVDHLLLHCDVVYAIWSVFFFPVGLGLAWVIPRRVVDLYVCWWTTYSTRSADVWNIVPTCLWCLWRERNNKSFEDRERTLEKIASLFFKTLYLSTSPYVSSLSISYSDFLVLFAHSS